MTRTLPNALVVGPRKAGTSWLQQYFASRGDVALPKGVKETFFFDRYHRKGLDWYAAHFQTISPTQCQIEVAPTYFEDPTAPQRIYDALGPIPIIVTLRDPAERTFSLYLHLRRYGETRLAFREAVQNLGLLTGSLYAARLQTWWDLFGRDRVKVVFMDDLAADPASFVATVDAFLGLGPKSLPEKLNGKVYAAAQAPNFWVARATNLVAQTLRSLRLYAVVNWLKATPLKAMIFGRPNTSAPIETLSPEDRDWLLAQGLQADIDILEKMLGADFSAWKSQTHKGDRT